MNNAQNVPAQEHGAAQASNVRAGLLTAGELETYHRNGFVVPQFRLAGEEVARLRDLMFRLVADNPALADKMMNLPHIPGAGSQGLRSSPGWMDFAAHPVIVDMVGQIVGPDIILRGSAAFYKRAGNGPATPWHRDSATLPIKPLVAMSVWIAVSDATVANACLRFIPGSHLNQSRGVHRQDTRAGVTFGLTLDESEYDESTAVDVKIEAGQNGDLRCVRDSRLPTQSGNARARRLCRAVHAGNEPVRARCAG